MLVAPVAGRVWWEKRGGYAKKRISRRRGWGGALNVEKIRHLVISMNKSWILSCRSSVDSIVPRRLVSLCCRGFSILRDVLRLCARPQGLEADGVAVSFRGINPTRDRKVGGGRFEERERCTRTQQSVRFPTPGWEFDTHREKNIPVPIHHTRDFCRKKSFGPIAPPGTRKQYHMLFQFPDPVKDQQFQRHDKKKRASLDMTQRPGRTHPISMAYTRTIRCAHLSVRLRFEHHTVCGSLA